MSSSDHATRRASGPRGRAFAVLLLALALPACGRDRAEEERPIPELGPRPILREEVTPREREDPRERPLEGSGRNALGIELPERSEEIFASDARASFVVDARLDQVQAYFGPRVRTGDVRTTPRSVRYVDARPRTRTTDDERLLDITLVRRGPKTHVSMTRPPRAPADLPPLEERARTFREHLNRLD